MKRRTIITLIIAGVFFVSGIICCGVGASMVDFDFTRLGTVSSYEKKQYEVSAAEIASFSVTDRNNGIIILPSPDDKIRITYYENEKELYEIGEKDGTLSVEYRDMRKWYEYIGISWTVLSRDMIIELPADYSGAFTAESSNGKMSLSDMNFTGGDISLQTSNAPIHVNNVTAAGDLTADTDNGTVTLSKTQVTGELQIRTKNGKVVTEGVGAQGNMSLKTSNGAVLLDITELGSGLSCQTKNGPIKGTVPGDMSDYSITAETSNGKSNLPERYTGGEKTLALHTSNGAIQVEFR